MKLKPLDEATMADGHARCLDLLCAVFKGRHHVPPVYQFGAGIKCSVYGGADTFDADLLTRLVVLCHDRAIRGEIVSSGPNRIGILLHPRQREGGIAERHPTIEDAIAGIRSRGDPVCRV